MEQFLELALDARGIARSMPNEWRRDLLGDSGFEAVRTVAASTAQQQFAPGTPESLWE
ncbi:hypothetical protein [Pseudomonas azerbaijanoccidentalis]